VQGTAPQISLTAPLARHTRTVSPSDKPSNCVARYTPRSWYGLPKRGSFDFGASGQLGAGPLGHEVGCEGQGFEGADKEADIQILSHGLKEGEKWSDEVGGDDSGNVE
jgi:hypothetical protein